MPVETTHVLIIDDDLDDFHLTKDVIEEIVDGNYVVDWARTFAEGLQILEDHRHDVCLVDYRIGADTGIDFIRTAKRLGAHVPLILLTGLRERAVDIEATRAGASDFLEKGRLSPELLERSIRYAVASAKAMQDIARQTDLLEATLNHTGNGIAAFDQAGELAMMNGRLREMFSVPSMVFGPNAQKARWNERLANDPDTYIKKVFSLFLLWGAKKLDVRTGADEYLELVANPMGDGGLVMVARDVTKQRAYEAALLRARDEAEAASRTKSSLIANISHELRTPLNSIIGFSELIQQGVHGPVMPPEYQAYIDDVHTSGINLLSIINAILDFSKIEAGTYHLTNDALLICSEVAYCRKSLAREAAANKITVHIEHEDDQLEIEGDVTAIRRIITSILSNAIKFSNCGCDVNISTGHTLDGGAHIVIADRGIGISQEQLDTVFEPFQQADTAKNRPYEGTGLGLTIAKSLMSLHEGQIRLRSTPGEGTEVELYFPPSRVVHDEPAAAHRSTAA